MEMQLTFSLTCYRRRNKGGVKLPELPACDEYLVADEIINGDYKTTASSSSPRVIGKLTVASNWSFRRVTVASYNCEFGGTRSAEIERHVVSVGERFFFLSFPLISLFRQIIRSHLYFHMPAVCNSQNDIAPGDSSTEINECK